MASEDLRAINAAAGAFNPFAKFFKGDEPEPAGSSAGPATPDAAEPVAAAHTPEDAPASGAQSEPSASPGQDMAAAPAPESAGADADASEHEKDKEEAASTD